MDIYATNIEWVDSLPTDGVDDHLVNGLKANNVDNLDAHQINNLDATYDYSMDTRPVSSSNGTNFMDDHHVNILYATNVDNVDVIILGVIANIRAVVQSMRTNGEEKDVDNKKEAHCDQDEAANDEGDNAKENKPGVKRRSHLMKKKMEERIMLSMLIALFMVREAIL